MEHNMEQTKAKEAAVPSPVETAEVGLEGTRNVPGLKGNTQMPGLKEADQVSILRTLSNQAKWYLLGNWPIRGNAEPTAIAELIKAGLAIECKDVAGKRYWTLTVKGRQVL